MTDQELPTWEEIKNLADLSLATALNIPGDDDLIVHAAVAPLVKAIKAMATLMERHEMAIQRAAQQTKNLAATMISPLPGPYRMNEEDGCAMRVEYEVPSRAVYRPKENDFVEQVRAERRRHHSPGRVVLTDCYGGQEMTIDKLDWLKWPLVDDSDDDRR